MKKRLSVAITFLFVMVLSLSGVTVKKKSFHFSKGTFEIERKGKMIKVKVNMLRVDSFPLLFDSAVPALPVFNYELVSKVDTAKYDVKFDVKVSDRILIEKNVDIASEFPIKYFICPCITEGKKKPKIKFKKEKWRKYKNFKELGEEKIYQIKQSSGNWHITLSPFEYDKKTKSLYLTEDVEVDVIYTKKDTTESPYKVKWMRRE
ncbi:MAG: hypothetical protein K2J87_05330 [Muribaculaceae bacterium]|nr:hypothetical protein [Muribaculaceae bacterium]